jgi:hypothetical protein
MMLMTTTHVGHDDRRYLLLICFFVHSCKTYCVDVINFPLMDKVYGCVKRSWVDST